MPESKCPVNIALGRLSQSLQAQGVSHPKSRRVAEELQTLVTDIAMGRAGDRHLSSMQERIWGLRQIEADAPAVELAAWLESHLAEHGEVFESHIATHNCATGDCDFLTPAPCQMTCPAGIDVPTYVSLIAMGKDDEAIEIIRRDNPFPWVCGLVCTRPCEFMCVRARIDTPVSIKFLKAFAAERALSWGQYRNPAKEPANHRKVCIVGAGPAGLRPLITWRSKGTA